MRNETEKGSWSRYSIIYEVCTCWRKDINIILNITNSIALTSNRCYILHILYIYIYIYISNSSKPVALTVTLLLSVRHVLSAGVQNVGEKCSVPMATAQPVNSTKPVGRQVAASDGRQRQSGGSVSRAAASVGQ